MSVSTQVQKKTYKQKPVFKAVVKGILEIKAAVEVEAEAAILLIAPESSVLNLSAKESLI
jgi:hypothetical protein